jgi:flagellar hook-associated protein 2
MSLSGINFSGLGTGIDTESIISQLSKIEQRPIEKLQARQQQIRTQQTALTQVTALVTGLQAAASTLNGASGFSLVKASVTDETIAKITAQAGAQTGSHTLTVNQLAQTQKLGSAVMASQTDPLGVTGQFVINGKAVTVAGTDSLQTIASNINAAQSGVNASIISPTSNSFMLVLTSTSSGTANTISLADVGAGTILQSTLGLIDNTAAIRSPITNGAASSLFADSSTSIASLVGLSSPPAAPIQINGTGVSIDLSTDSLTAILGKINAAAIPGVTASIVSTTDPNSGASRQQLKITGATTPTFTDSSIIL